jgi:TPR repeat protein
MLKRTFLATIGTLMVMCVPGLGVADDVKDPNSDAWLAYAEGHFDVARDLWLKAAEQGNARAMLALGTLYRTGQGVQKDLKQAAVYYRRGADAGDAEAAHNLASMYIDGDGVPKDMNAAKTWYTKAAERGFLLSQRQLGAMAAVDKDYSTAVKWWSLAAGRGDPESQYQLGMLYLFGRGTAQDDRAALVLFTAAARSGHPQAQQLYERYIKDNKYLKTN